ncbi:fibulin-1 isoform X3 [Zootermopsis nevadensis]|uniref:fibulin-1 isoform X3 n=1 Tax=Zootermopsis nevadensis TaxID=136037 RepID=UPI000B8E9ABA|nr:fibulin-1 isoform X3 [Zootermopsis nevadensis]
MFLIVRWSRWFRSCVILWFLLQMCKCALEPTFKRCCSLGSNWASEGLKCNNFPAPVTGIQPEQQSVCLTAVEICCLRKHREKQCEIGKEDARSDSSCQTASITGGEYRKDCCEACKLGLMSGSMGMECVFESFEFEPPWDKAYHACCLETQPSTSLPTTTSASATAGNPENKTTVIPTPALDSLCELLPGELCAHICVPVPGSFRCECREGFTLMADGKSCQHDDLPDRCKINNPCAHKCLDTGIAIECSCHPGYKLASDERNCNDVNECALGIYSCDSEDQACRNEPGSYLCINPDGSVAKPLPRETDRELENDFGAGKCPLGYKFSMQSQVCDDIDECALNVANCGTSSACQNTIGSYICVRTPVESCPPGYRFDHIQQICSDIDECSEGLDDCQGDKYLCFNTEGNYTCQPQHDSKCPAGYKYSKDAASCEDIDECHIRQHSCKVGRCLNTIGSYTCTSEPETVCPAGYKPSLKIGKQCEDVDECKENVDSCDRHSETCINQIGSFKCEPIVNLIKNESRPRSLRPAHTGRKSKENQVDVCPSGYSYSYTRKACLDVDECLMELHNCSLRDGEQCVNMPGTFICKLSPKCPPGYQYNKTTLKCEDVNECDENHLKCTQEEDCVNTQGSFRCIRMLRPSSTSVSSTTISPTSPEQSLPDSNQYCPAGFRYNAQRGRCFDVNECEEGTHVCNLEACINEPGGYRCGPTSSDASQCQAGFKLDHSTNTCVDVDECVENVDPPCDSNQDCINSHGSFQCVCKTGFQFDSLLHACVDVNECQVNKHDCLPSQRCDNTIGSFHCIRYTSCGTGYTLNAQTGLCEDDDECSLGTDNCRNLGPTWQCRNTLGSFRCERKRCDGKKVLLNNGECKLLECPTGYEASQQGQCIDINECEHNNPCRRNQRCVNTGGSYRCINYLNCGGGFELNESGNQCIDIDECAKSTHDCGHGQQCINRVGGYVCQCPGGHIINEKKECIDVDECTRYAGQVCATNSKCVNTVGSYRCACSDGFRQDPKGGNGCVDIDECAESPGLCEQNCINIWGSYRCSCNPGFALKHDNRSCLDIDECEQFKDHNLCVGICVNQPGSYSCQCPEGYRIGTDGRTCQDIDECLGGNNCHNPNEVCLNTRGGHRCNSITCPPNFIKDPEHKNRCKRASLFCREGDTECLHLPSSISFNFITFVSNLAMPPTGYIDLFTMRGPLWSSSSVRFKLDMLDSRAPAGIFKATKDFFHLRQTALNQAIISLKKSIEGPQEIDLQLSMELYHGGVFGGSAVAKLSIFVSEYEF